MEKAVLNQEQAEAIEKLLSLDVVTVKQIIKYNVNGIKEIDKCTYAETISKMNLDALIKALYIGYEVEPEYKVGEWKVVKYSNEIGQVVEHFKEKQRVELDCNYFTYKEVDLRSATPEEESVEKERRRWAKHGRKVDEYREGDVVYLNGHVSEVHYVQDGGNSIKVCNFISYKQPEHLDIVCFAEDRKDVKE